ncbi:MAG: aa3-type cytochrome c oxidase subunit IV [Sulfitobacter sp.]|uniref:Aa3-type cytochrome c oxidase subunit IV n=1 Tax=Sulfitobacter sediminilitoris TaxID=2698830 RepID=A0A6P0CDK2_9RHOB|nr:aa3-type cytochrome c oxidase subunit IV [Sulfitobacter sediminilitoris]NEK22563.1 aa3-type cytochrome c oxidase subunit IV [Sulfitobacter sediminilitoris]NNK17381.1 aa3-type cytochrome c oxidase subunit IV [Sulfitobacter sp.]
MADHEHGSMDIKTQEKTFEGFMSFVTKTTVVILVLLVLMALFIR